MQQKCTPYAQKCIRGQLLSVIRLHIILKLAFNNRDLRAVNDLHATATADNTARTARLKNVIRNKAFVLNRYTQTSGTAIKRYDIVVSAKSFENKLRNCMVSITLLSVLLFVVVRASVKLDLFFPLFTSGRCIIPTANEETAFNLSSNLNI